MFKKTIVSWLVVLDAREQCIFDSASLRCSVLVPQCHYNPHLCPLSLSQVCMHFCPVSLTPIDIKEQQLLCYWIPWFIPYGRLWAKKSVTHFLRICIVEHSKCNCFLALFKLLLLFAMSFLFSWPPPWSLSPVGPWSPCLPVGTHPCFPISWIHPHPSSNSRLVFPPVSLWMSRDISIEHI